MRKTIGLLCAAAMILPLGIITAGPAGAAGGTTCKTFTGTVVFHPPLPPLGSSTKVKGYFTVTGKLSGCSGGGVTSGAVSGKSVPSTTGSNCTTLATSKTPSKVNLTTKWNNGKTSTGPSTSTPTKNPTIQNVAGSITSGTQFKGLHLSTQVQYTLPKGACSAGHPLSKVTLKNLKPVVIK